MSAVRVAIAGASELAEWEGHIEYLPWPRASGTP